jgi:hypothetical protein
MKKFKNGNLETVVENDDSRITEYLANGWKEIEFILPIPDETGNMLKKSAMDASNSEAVDDGLFKKDKAVK